MYSELPSRRHVRILVLEPGRQSDSVVCFLEVHALSKSLRFEALSYEWKKHQGLCNIICCNTQIQITKSLAHALKSLRLLEGRRTLWADAICINQTDANEKSVQIPLMCEIYASAVRVLSWLGPSFRGADEAYRLFPQLAMLGAERHPTGKPDTENVHEFMKSMIKVLPENGNILRSRNEMMFLSHDRDSMIVQSLGTGENFHSDVLFGPGSDETWAAIDRLFSSSYFQRSWIVQEVAVADAVYMICGRHEIHWDVFRMAYEGRMVLLLQRPPLNISTMRHIPMIRDARVRHRRTESSRCFDLGVVLSSFTYTEEEVPHDRIYAALGIVRPQSLITNIVPDYNKPVEDVFYEASCHIIYERQDLFLWGTKSLLSRRTMKSLPTWVPEWTMEPVEEAIEFANLRLCMALSGRFEIQDRSLFLDGHILDEISITVKIKKEKDIFAIFTIIQAWFLQHKRTLLDAYGFNDHGLAHDELFDGVGDASDVTQVLAEFTNIPTVVAEFLKSANCTFGTPCEVLNLEALWLTLTAVTKRRHSWSHPPGTHLFLSLIYIASWTATTSGCLGKLEVWIKAAILLFAGGVRNFDMLCAVVSTHLEGFGRDDISTDSLFVTKSGLFGLAPDGVVKPGQVVAILGGGYVPYLLERKDTHYRLASHAYVQGFMSLANLPTTWEVQRIEIR